MLQLRRNRGRSKSDGVLGEAPAKQIPWRTIGAWDDSKEAAWWSRQCARLRESVNPRPIAERGR
jgi:hypothetical protein